MWIEYVKVFLVEGTICAAGQALLDLTKMSTAKILVVFVTAGVVLGAVGVYKPLADFAGAGATVPLTGFGYALSEGVRKAIAEQGPAGMFTGGITAAAAGITAALFFGFLAALLSKPKPK